ncbi:MAG: hypothetical protein IPO00_00610 [Betaproteobacteria bacterium]|jgi:hypothetical protein|nr:hypothetical protein [Betaproteobacteria bacterium]
MLSSAELISPHKITTDARLASNLAAMFNPVLYPGTGSERLISQEKSAFSPVSYGSASIRR